MTFGEIFAKHRRRGHMRSWKLSKVQPQLAAFIVITELLAVLVVTGALLGHPAQPHDVGGLTHLKTSPYATLAVLAGLCGLSSRSPSRIERMRIRMADAATST